MVTTNSTQTCICSARLGDNRTGETATWLRASGPVLYGKDTVSWNKSRRRFARIGICKRIEAKTVGGQALPLPGVSAC